MKIAWIVAREEKAHIIDLMRRLLARQALILIAPTASPT